VFIYHRKFFYLKKTFQNKNKMKYSEYFDKRKNTFEESFKLILYNLNNNNKTYNIIELGSCRSFVSIKFTGAFYCDEIYWKPKNPELWDWGAGVFTKVFSENLKGKNYKLFTIDPDPDANKIVSTMCFEDKSVIPINGYSTDFLKTIDFKIDFLYMDHMESGTEYAYLKHLEDCQIIVEKNLMEKNGLILIDDAIEKGIYSIPYLLKNKYRILIQEYQVLMQKQ